MPDYLDETLTALAAPAGTLRPDWSDVASRAQRARRRSVAVFTGAGAVVLASTALAVAPSLLKPDALAFMRSVTLPETTAPPSVRRAFATHKFAGKPRRAVVVGTAHGPMTLWVSPHRGGGWCEGLQGPRASLGRFSVTCHWWRADFGAFGGAYGGPKLFEGRAAVSRGRRLRLLFADGHSLPITTRDGFYVYRVPDRDLIRSKPKALVLSDAHGEIARQRILNPYASDLPYLITGSLRRPGGADLARARRLLVRPTAVGVAAVFVAPSTLKPASCSWLQIRRAPYGGGCLRNDKPSASLWRVTALSLRAHGHELQVLWGRVGSDYRRLDLRFQDGRTRRLQLRRGFFLYVVPRGERQPGRRPALLLGRGSQVRRKELLIPFLWAP